MSRRIDIESPRYDQNAFEGRAKHFFITTNPLNLLASDAELDKAKAVVDAYRSGKSIEELNVTEDELWAAKQLYDSAFHCQTGEKLFILGRMSFQVPGNMLISGCMMTFYKSTPAVIFWQTMNQSFNAIVNYSNRNASVGVSNEQLASASVAATAAGVLTALGFNKVIQSSPALSSGMVGRFVPLLAVAAANCVNIPLMRQQVRACTGTAAAFCMCGRRTTRPDIVLFILLRNRKLRTALISKPKTALWSAPAPTPRRPRLPR